MFGMVYYFNLGVQELLILAAIGLLMVGSVVGALMLLLRDKGRDDSREG